MMGAPKTASRSLRRCRTAGERAGPERPGLLATGLCSAVQAALASIAAATTYRFSTRQHLSAPVSTLQHLSAPFSTSQHLSPLFDVLERRDDGVDRRRVDGGRSRRAGARRVGIGAALRERHAL